MFFGRCKTSIYRLKSLWVLSYCTVLFFIDFTYFVTIWPVLVNDRGSSTQDQVGHYSTFTSLDGLLLFSEFSPSKTTAVSPVVSDLYTSHRHS